MFVFDVALGKALYYGGLPAADDSLILVAFEEDPDIVDEDLSALETLEDVKAVLVESSMGRVTATTATVGIGVASLTHPGWSTPSTDDPVTRLMVFYKPTAAAADADIVPLVSLDIEFTPDSISDFTPDLNTDGYFEAVSSNYA